MKLGIINGVYAEEGYDHQKTVALAAGSDPDHEEFRVEFVQIYLNDANVDDDTCPEMLASLCNEKGLGLIGHLHGHPDGEKLMKAAKAHSCLLRHQLEKRVVVHYDSVLETQDLLKVLTKAGLIPFVENYHVGLGGIEGRKQEQFVEFVCKRAARPVGAVLDFGRYYHARRCEPTPHAKSVTALIVKTYRRFVEADIPVFFHTVGSKTHFMKRADWVSPGSVEDVIPQREIVQGICQIRKTEGPLILESERVDHAVAGVEIFRRIFNQASP